MDDVLNKIHHGDCIKGLYALPAGSVDLAFADPPFNIGYDYDVYQDKVEHEHYIDWSSEWISAVHRVLKSNGTFWLAIGDEYAAELKLASQKIGFHCRSWVIWYYTFGVNCSRKFTRSHAHLFHFVKDPANFTFREDDPDNRIPSARQLVYNDKRANPKGRLPDDTWIIRPANAVGELVGDDVTWSPGELEPPSDGDQTFTLRPQDLDRCFKPSEDTWYFPRVAGTFKERAGFHGCQMPEQLLARIIRTCSNHGELVLDPFSGSATTLAVAKKLGRQFLGFDLSADYVRLGRERLASIRVGDRPDGSAEPLMSAPKTVGPVESKGERTGRRRRPAAPERPASADVRAQEKRYEHVQFELTLAGVAEAFRLTHDGFSADRIVADPELNQEFIETCERLSLVGDARTWNTLLFRQRKAGKLVQIDTERRTEISWDDCDDYLFASEIALQMLLDEGAESLDDILCDPLLATRFDEIARRFAPGHTSLEYRWAALKLRKEAKKARSRGAVLKPPSRFEDLVPLAELDTAAIPEGPGAYVLSLPSRKLYVGEALNLRRRLGLKFRAPQRKVWDEYGAGVSIQTLSTAASSAGKFAWQSCLIMNCKQRPALNYAELCG
jgi:site-specific DNA-methyltransferase (adenine-specific)